MFKYLLAVLSLITIPIITLSAQSVKQIEPNYQDYISLLNESGYMVYSYDISELKDSTYQIKLVIKEYELGKEEPIKTHDFKYGNLQNRLLVKDFMWRELSDDELEDLKNNSDDFENGIFRVSDKISVGFLPVENDSIESFKLKVDNIGTVGSKLILRSISHGADSEKEFSYGVRPFTLSSFKPNTFIPLALYGSYWYDEQFDIVRFCGEREIDPELNAEILKDSPHYYIIGVIFKPL